jgi:hypothetical protein
MEIIAGYYRLSSCPNWTVLDSLYRINKSVRPVQVSFRTRTGGQESRTRTWMDEIYMIKRHVTKLWLLPFVLLVYVGIFVVGIFRMVFNK